MNNQHAFLYHYKHLLQNRLLAEALALATERLKHLQSDGNAGQEASVTVLQAIKLADESSDMFQDLETKLLNLGQLLECVSDNQIKIDRPCAAGDEGNGSAEQIVSTLSVWLENISRIKAHAGHIE